jgi:ribosomal protein S5
MILKAPPQGYNFGNRCLVSQKRIVTCRITGVSGSASGKVLGFVSAVRVPSARQKAVNRAQSRRNLRLIPAENSRL